MRRITSELYGVVPKEILEKRKELAEYFIKAAKKRVKELQKVEFLKRDDALINDCLKAQEHWKKLGEE